MTQQSLAFEWAALKVIVRVLTFLEFQKKNKARKCKKFQSKLKRSFAKNSLVWWSPKNENSAEPPTTSREVLFSQVSRRVSSSLKIALHFACDHDDHLELMRIREESRIDRIRPGLDLQSIRITIEN